MGYGQYSAMRGNGGRGSGLTVVQQDRKRRKRSVWPERDVARIWAEQSQDAARNRTGNFYFRGTTIYSYGSHFPIADLTDKKLAGKRVVLYTSKDYSPTTSGHKSTVWSALRHWDGDEWKMNAGFVVIEVLDVLPGSYHHKANYEALFDRYQNLLASAKRARQNRAGILRSAEKVRQDLNNYAKVFCRRIAGCRPIPVVSDLYEQIEEADKLAEKLRKIAERRRKQKEFEEHLRYATQGLDLVTA